MAATLGRLMELTGRPIEEIIAQLGLADSVQQALIAGHGELGCLLKITESCETGDLHMLSHNLHQLPGLGAKALNHAQTQALQWANSINQ